MDIKTIVKHKTDGVMGAAIHVRIITHEDREPYSLLTVAWQSGEITTVTEDEVEHALTPATQTLKEKLKEEADART